MPRLVASRPPAKVTPIDTAPADPRSRWDLPAFGDMPVVASLDESVTRVLAPNPSPMTLDGTNTYVVHAGGAAMVVDPGPTDDEHLERVVGVVEELDVDVTAVVVTHHHVDHAAAAASWARSFGAVLHAPSTEVAGPDGVLLTDGARIDVPGLDVTAVATPGHCADHMVFRLGTGAVLSGDHVLGRGTSVVAYPDGDLTAYLDSLRRVHDMGAHALYPGHGPALTEDPTAVLDFYLEHRAFREAQVVAVLSGGPATPRQIVEVVYAEVAEFLWAAAELSTRAALDRLVQLGRVHMDDDVAQLVDVAR